MNKAYLYTETAFHHQGNYDYLIKLIDASLQAGAKGVKFQVLTQCSDFVSTRHKAFADLASYCFSKNEWDQVFKYTSAKGLDVILMPLNVEAVELSTSKSVKYIDIHSVSFNDIDLLQAIRNSGVGVILGAGGRTLDEILAMRDFFADQLRVLMVGFQSFPSQLEEVKLNKITILKQLFPDLLIGYADHSSFDHIHAISSNDYARLLGASVFEKHIAIEEGINRIDYASAVSPEKIATIVSNLAFLDQHILNNPGESMRMSQAEVVYRNRQLRCVAATRLTNGTVLTKENVGLKLVDNPDLTYTRYEEVINRKLCKDLEQDEPITTNSLI
ncbi:MAG: N-acetylneuraminate synthase family protein [Bacteroidetes bacterium]|nr:N-acetylneuraminate synthase family protein [Bacteroidota bacterium]